MTTCYTGPCWGERYFPLMSEPLDVISGGGFIIISGRDFNFSGYDVIIQYSADNGETWTRQNFGYLGGTWAQHITYGNGIFVGLVGFLSRIIGVPSGNTITWTINTGSTFISSDGAMGFDGTNFFALAPSQTGNPQQSIAYSSDGITWAFGSPVSGSGLRNLQYGSGIYVATFSNGIWYGTTLDMFTPFTFTSSIDITDLAFGSGTFVGTNGSNVYTSTNGSTWTAQANAPYDITGLTYDQNVFMAVNVFSTAVAVSTDAGISWTLSDSEHQLPSSNTDPLQPQYIGYDIIAGDSTGNYIALFVPRPGLGIPQGVVAPGVCPCIVPGDYWLKLNGVTLSGVTLGQ